MRIDIALARRPIAATLVHGTERTGEAARCLLPVVRTAARRRRQA